MPNVNPFRAMAPELGLTPPQPLPWMTDALCARVDPDLFFEASTDRYHNRPDGQRESIAKSVCAKCEVRAECLEYALEADERYGIWGGMTERERRGMKRVMGA